MEAEKLRYQAQAERERREGEAQAEERRVQLEMRKIQANQEIELRRLDVQSAEASRSASSSSSAHLGNNNSSHRSRTIKLLMFEDDKDDLDAYLGRFERTFMVYELPSAEWSIQLAQLLKGTALEVYQRIPDERLGDYLTLKTALLKRFQMTEGGYRKRFKNSHIEMGETPDQFVARLQRYLTKWREMTGFEATFESIET